MVTGGYLISCVCFFICEMGIVIVPTSVGCYEDQIKIDKAFRTGPGIF